VKRCVKLKKYLVRLVLGDDIKLHKISEMETKVLVRKFMGRIM
jgi:hypothetical protein